MSYRPGLPHMAYFRALADAPSEQSSTWRSTVAGLVAMRLVDEWAHGGPVPSAGLQALQRTINMMDVDALERPSLKGLLEALLAEASGRDMRAESQVLRRVRDYAETLWLNAEWMLVADACRTAIGHAVTPAEHAIVPSLYDRLGNSLRATGRSDSALEAFETGRALACARGNLASDLYLRISEANLEAQRGNAPFAERLLDEVLVDAEHAALMHVCARAHHDRGVLAYGRGDHVAALTCYFRALSNYGTHERVERVLCDIAVVMMDLGLTDPARSAFCSLECYSVERVQRWTAALNLLRIAIADGNEPQFNAYRRKLASVRLSARLGAYYHTIVSEGWMQFDQPTLARRALGRAQEDALRYRVNELDKRLAECQRQLDRASNGRTSHPAEQSTSPPGSPSDLQPFIERTSAAVTEWQRARRIQLDAA